MDHFAVMPPQTMEPLSFIKEYTDYIQITPASAFSGGSKCRLRLRGGLSLIATAWRNA
jgi:hypothetical protein